MELLHHLRWNGEIRKKKKLAKKKLNSAPLLLSTITRLSCAENDRIHNILSPFVPFSVLCLSVRAAQSVQCICKLCGERGCNAVRVYSVNSTRVSVGSVWLSCCRWCGTAGHCVGWSFTADNAGCYTADRGTGWPEEASEPK